MDAITSDVVLIGVDTHKDIHVAVAINGLGARLGSKTIRTTSRGYHDLEIWARAFGTIHAFGIEGTGSYGAGLARVLHNQGHRIVEVNRTNRQLRRRRGKSDPIDAEAAARAVLAGEANATPKTGDGCAEMIRHLKVARETAVKCRTQTMITLKAILVNAPQAVRDQFQESTGTMNLIRGLAALRPKELISTVASAKTALRSLARRWLALDAEIKALDHQLASLARAHAPELMAAPGISTQTVAEMIVSVGDNPERIRSEAAFAKLCGACPIPASSGKTVRHRLNRGGNRHANAALHRVAIVRMRYHKPTQDYARRRIAEGKTTREITRCLKRYIAREIYHLLCRPNANTKIISNRA